MSAAIDDRARLKAALVAANEEIEFLQTELAYMRACRVIRVVNSDEFIDDTLHAQLQSD